MTAWTTWSRCDSACSVGKRARTREITDYAYYGGRTCPALEEFAACSTPVVACQDCEAAAWTRWSECTRTCGTAEQVRSGALAGVSRRERSLTQRSMGSARHCSLWTEERRVCTTSVECAADCVLSAWTDW